MSGQQAPKPAAQQTTVAQRVQPSIGRIVLHVRDGLARAAIITEVFDDFTVGLNVFRRYAEVDDRGEHPLHIVKADFSEQPAEGCWSWPPKVGA